MNDNTEMIGGGGWMWFLVLMFAMFGGGFGGFGINRPMPNFATSEQLQEGLNNQAVQGQLQQIALSSANNNYETAQLINGQTNTLMQQNNSNLINAIQGFNTVGAAIQNQTNVFSNQIQNQTNVLQAQLMGLQAQLNECCCSIKTQMLQDRLADRDAQLVSANNVISNNVQSQYLLSQMGRFVPWAGSGTQTAGT